MLRIVLLLAVVVVLIVLVPRLLSHSAAPTEGSSAPDFTLPSQEGSSVSLKDYRGKWVVLYFYPKDQTPGCSREAHNFQVDQPKYSERNAVVLGVSLDSVDSHKKFCAKEGLNFKLLADTDHKVTDSYGSLTNLGVVKFSARHTFLIDPNGKIAKHTRVSIRSSTAQRFLPSWISCRNPKQSSAEAPGRPCVLRDSSANSAFSSFLFFPHENSLPKSKSVHALSSQETLERNLLASSKGPVREVH